MVTRGMISPKQEFFEAAFGKTPQDCIKIAIMPDDYIIYKENTKITVLMTGELFLKN